MLFDEMGREAIVPGRHRRVRCKDNLAGDAALGLFHRQPFGHHPLPHQLECGEARYALR